MSRLNTWQPFGLSWTILDQATAVEARYNAINMLSDVARDQSDRGLNAVLNAYEYRPLVAEFDKLAE